MGCLALGFALVCAGEDVEEENKVFRGRLQVREARGLDEHRRNVEEGNVEMSDEPAAAVEETKKPKKKKTPEEIEAGKKELPQSGHM